MRNADRRSRSILGLSYASAVLSALVVLAFALASERQEEDSFRQKARAEAQDRLNLLRSDVQGAVDANVQLVNGLVAVLGYEPDIDQTRFSQLGERLLHAGTQICGLAAAPDLGPGMAYPFDPDRATGGLDPLRRAEAGRSARSAPAELAMTIEGPATLRQGVPGFVLRAPVFHDTGGRAAVLGHGVGRNRRTGALPRQRAASARARP